MLETFLERFPATVELSIAALLFAIVLGVPLGYLAAKRHGGALDSLTVSGSLLGVVVPVFFLAYLLKLVFAVGLDVQLGSFNLADLAVLPTAGRQNARIDATHITNFYVLDGLLTREWDAAWDALLHLVLPAIALGTIPLAIIVRITRASVLEVLGEDYVRTARAKGLARGLISRRHVLRNALLPVVTTIGLYTGLLLSGAVLTETVFAFNGIGEYLFQAISSLDFAVLQGFILFTTLVFADRQPAGRHQLRHHRPEDPSLMSMRRHLPREVGGPGAGTALGELPAAGGEDERGTSLLRGAMQRLVRNPVAIVGALIVLAFVLVAVFADAIAPYEPAGAQWGNQITPSSVPGPSDEHLLGLDSFGSDLYTQLVHGARQSLVIGIVSTSIGLFFGTLLGLASGAFGRWVDTLLMRGVDILLSIPSLLMAVSVAALMSPHMSRLEPRFGAWVLGLPLMIAIAVVQVPIFARLLRGSLLAQRNADYVLASISLGLRRRTVVMSHMLPNSLGPVIVQATLVLATAIIEVAALSYLGLGAPDPTVAEWGRMLVKAQSRLETDPQLALWPGVCIAVTALGFTLLGESLREALDPKFRR